MRFLRTIGAAGVAAVLTCVVAVLPAAAQNTDGSGLLRFGVFLQGTIVNADFTEREVGPPVVFDDGSKSFSGFGGGASFGYDHRFGNLVLGIEAALGLDTASGNYRGIDYGTNFNGDVRARIGAFFRPDWMLYATGGWAVLGAEAKFLDGATTRKIHNNFGGWTIGAGTEIRWGHVTLFGEYLFADYETFSFTNTAGDRYTIDPDSHVFRLGLKFNIGHNHYHDDVRGRPLK